ncbi:unnamed protein product [Cylicocyclus nassatus]|uniref:C2H2-type domain-containing protein n=1 Tax=Cylicocyclus nassatus TaxID=53992 RepID=A0AA36GG52_CYLNA|nr:unnamed protein product [Cylicocyclus nassatus]
MFQMETEVIILDSDDEDSTTTTPVNGSALASIDIVNSKPLDLDALGIGTVSSDEGVLNSSQNTRYYSARSMETRVQNLLPVNKIKSNTAYISKVNSVSPPRSKISYEKQRSQSTFVEDSGINALTLLGNQQPPRPIQPLSTAQMHSRPQSGSPLLRPVPRLVPESRVQNYNFEVCGEKSCETDRHLCPSLKFRCQYPSCRRVLTGNVSFVCHLWAHIAAWKEYDPKSPNYPASTESGSPGLANCKRNDVDILSTCPTCTARFHTPYLMQVHFTRCHSRQPQAVNRATCAICERDVRSDVGTASALRTHLLAHEPNDAPYHCKRCRYRCTVRMHLFDHFVREHKNTSTLMCPFCTFTTVVPSYQRKRPVIRASEFVYHMISHESEARLGCDHCALSFSSLMEKQKHRKEHSAVNPKWTLTYRNPETRSRPRSRLVCPEQKPLYQCSKCASSSESNANHKKCIACITLAFNESLYGKRRAITDTSLRRGIDSLQCSIRGMRFRCKCGLSTRNGNRMALHYYYCHKDFDVVETDDEFPEQNESDEAEDKLEAQLFSVLHKVEPTIKIREKVTERKRKFIEPPLMIFEQQMNNVSKPEDIKSAVLFYRKSSANIPRTSFESFRDLRASVA